MLFPRGRLRRAVLHEVRPYIGLHRDGSQRLDYPLWGLRDPIPHCRDDVSRRSIRRLIRRNLLL